MHQGFLNRLSPIYMGRRAAAAAQKHGGQGGWWGRRSGMNLKLRVFSLHNNSTPTPKIGYLPTPRCGLKTSQRSDPLSTMLTMTDFLKRFQWRRRSSAIFSCKNKCKIFFLPSLLPTFLRSKNHIYIHKVCKIVHGMLLYSWTKWSFLPRRIPKKIKSFPY